MKRSKKKEPYSSLKARISKEALYNYYIKDNHKFKDTMKYFNISSHMLGDLLQDYKIDKSKHLNFHYRDGLYHRKEKAPLPSKQELEQYYIIEKHSKDETTAHFNISYDLLRFCCKEYNLNRHDYDVYFYQHYTEDDVYNYYIVENHTYKDTYNHFRISHHFLDKLIAKNNWNKHELFSDTISRISREDILQYYIIEDHLVYDTAQHFNITIKFLANLLKYYNITNNKSILKHQLHIEDLAKRISKEEILECENKSYSQKYVQNKYNISEGDLYSLCDFYNIKYKSTWHKSKLEEEIKNIFINENIKFNDRSVLGNRQELDIYFPDYRLGIEVNGDYWHSEKYCEKYYHQNKAIIAQEKNIQIIFIWEHEWNNPLLRNKIINYIKQIIGKAKKINIEDCTIKKITNKEAKEFVNKYGLFNYKDSEIIYGVFHDNFLIQIMSFNKARYVSASNNEWEVVRNCTNPQYSILNGTKQVLNMFIKEIKPKSIIAYIDFNKFNGELYEQLGMVFSNYTQPNLKWLLEDKTVVDKCPKTEDPRKQPIARLWDAGCKKYILKLG